MTMTMAAEKKKNATKCADAKATLKNKGKEESDEGKLKGKNKGGSKLRLDPTFQQPGHYLHKAGGV